MPVRFTSGLLFVLAIPLMSCGDSVQDNRDVWEKIRPNAYVFEYQRSCFCPGAGAWWRITVRRDSVVGVELIDTTEAGRWLAFARHGPHPTISSLFEDLERDSASPSAQVRVQYDRVWHFPVSIDLDPIPNAMDDEWGVIIRGFHPIL